VLRNLINTSARAIVAFVFLGIFASTATGASPIRRGGPGYDPNVRASYESIKARHSALIDQQSWGFLLEVLETEFFIVSPAATAEQKALEGFQTSKHKFLVSLQNENLDLQGQVELAGEGLDVNHSEIRPEDYAPRAYAVEALPGSMVILFKDDFDMSGTTLFSGSVSMTDASLPMERRQELFTLSEAIYLILQDAMVPYRQATLAAITAAKTRWEDYNSTVVAHQFPWEMGVNELLKLTGTIESPPTTQIAFLHPILAVEFADPHPDDAWKPADELSVNTSMLVNLAGFNLYDKNSKYERKWGLALGLSLSDGIDVPAWGPSLGIGRWVDIAYVWRSGGGIDTTALVFSADLWGLIKKGPSGFVRDNSEWLENARAFLN
jgi:hypothetical protein